MEHPPKTISRDAIALQLWTIRDAMASDADSALRRARAAGFAAVEVAPLPPGLTPGHLAECLARHGLSVSSIHGELPTAANIDSLLGLAHACGCSKAIWHGWPRDPRFDSLAGLRDLIAACNQAGSIARDSGLRFGIHNHWWEFDPVEGVAPIRLFHESLDPEIFWQLDVYWARTAGADPASVLSELAPRVGSIHWKDGPAVHGEPMTALGGGILDLPRVFRSLVSPVDWVIELDDCATDPLEAAQRSLAYLESLRGDPEPAG
ncbi:MAG: Xylose isomerase-like barrel [Planctomycetota bacterium]|nr:Xylose isomerase-like barrel [Planctomycetota bacterium]